MVAVFLFITIGDLREKEKKRKGRPFSHRSSDASRRAPAKKSFFLNLSLGGTSYSYVCPEPVLANIRGFCYRKVAPRNKRRFFPHQGVGDQAHDQRSPGLNQQLVARAQQARCPYPRPGLAQRLAPPRPAQNGRFPQLFLCLSQACLGMMIVFQHQNGAKKVVFPTGRPAQSRWR